MPFSPEEQVLYEFAKGALPRFLFDGERPEEDMGALVKVADGARQIIAYWFTQSYILQATGPLGGDAVDWLDQHARDRGTMRANGETDALLRERLRTIPDQITRPVLLEAAQDILDAQVPPVAGGVVYMVEYREARAFFQDMVAMNGTGDSFSKVGDVVTLTDAAFSFPNQVAGAGGALPIGRPGMRITIAGATSAGNDGTFTITGVTLHSVSWTNAAGVAEAFPGTWSIDKRRDGRKHSYLSRGYRMTSQPGFGLALMLPFGTTASTEAQIAEMLRIRSAAGVKEDIERRLNP